MNLEESSPGRAPRSDSLYSYFPILPARIFDRSRPPCLQSQRPKCFDYCNAYWVYSDQWKIMRSLRPALAARLCQQGIRLHYSTSLAESRQGWLVSPGAPIAHRSEYSWCDRAMALVAVIGIIASGPCDGSYTGRVDRCQRLTAVIVDHSIVTFSLYLYINRWWFRYRGDLLALLRLFIILWLNNYNAAAMFGRINWRI